MLIIALEILLIVKTYIQMIHNKTLAEQQIL